MSGAKRPGPKCQGAKHPGPKCRGETSCPKSQRAKRPGPKCLSPKSPGGKTLPEPSLHDCESLSVLSYVPIINLINGQITKKLKEQLYSFLPKTRVLIG